jgi:3-oxo-5alpha-steroid 4-dehydrogenase
MQKLLAAVEASPARLVADARAASLVRNADGSIAGLLARVEREPVTIRARRGVVLTTGGFINDEEMLALHAPLLRRCSIRVGAEGDDGSGIRMGMAAGAGTLNLGAGSISLPIHPPKSCSTGVLINAQGQRFVNEDVYMGRLGEQVLLHQGGEAYLLFDEPSFERPSLPRDVVAVGETWAELEAELGVPEGALQATMELYNRFARRGEDPLFHKRRAYLTALETPPFGALDCRVDTTLFAAFTLGGLHTNAHGEVLTPAGEVIPGLYAAGRSTSGLAAPGYSSGLSLGDGSFFGRRAGRRAASRRA